MQLSERQQDGRTLRDHLLSAQVNGDHSHPLLRSEPLPPGGAELWALYLRLSRLDRHGLGGEQPSLSPNQLLAWQRLHGVQLSAWELDTLDAIEMAAVAHHATQASARGAAAGADVCNED